jgi:xanthine dehydrogenase accessory factor
MKNIYLRLLDLHNADSPMVLATVTLTHGSTPQKPGSSALFSTKGLDSGTVGGGVVEGKVQKLADDSMRSKNSGLYHFNLAHDILKTDEAICGGQIDVLIDAGIRNSVPVFEQLKQSLADRIPGVLITKLTGSSDTSVVITRYWMSMSFTPPIPEKLLAKLKPEIWKLLSEKNPSGFRELEIGQSGEEQISAFFLQPFFPPDQLIIAGAGHIGKALAHIGSLLDFEVTVIDDRSEFANSGNIPDADHIVVKDIGEAVNEVDVGDNSYMVIVTRGHKDDASALKSCIGKDLAYTGMIGSKTKIAAMRQSFIDQGWTSTTQWDKIHAPVGLAIKSQTVEEIAVSIAAELVLVRNSKR